MTPLYKCDFCLQLFTENELEMCTGCGELFCVKCVENPESLYIFGGENSYFCSDICLVGFKTPAYCSIDMEIESPDHEQNGCSPCSNFEMSSPDCEQQYTTAHAQTDTSI